MMQLVGALRRFSKKPVMNLRNKCNILIDLSEYIRYLIKYFTYWSLKKAYKHFLKSR
jgi:hypothetical protein